VKGSRKERNKWPCKALQDVALTWLKSRYIIIALAFYVKPDGDAGNDGKGFFAHAW
jgi:hypothetical protein